MASSTPSFLRWHAGPLRAVAALALAVVCSPSLADDRRQAGEVIFVLGDVRLDGEPARIGARVSEGQAIRTGAASHIYIRTVDRGYLILRENSQAQVIAYRVDPAAADQRAVKYELKTGVARHISGEAVRQNPQVFRFNTPVAAIGVRGTDFTVSADDVGSRISVLAGGVIVSGFGAACSPGGLGPCDAAGARELLAGDPSALLQVRRGERAPELVRSLESRPDAVAGPRVEEANRPGRTHSGASSSPGPDVSAAIEDRRAVTLAAAAQAVPLPAPPPPLPPPPPELVWGRWQAFADLPAADVKLALAAGANYGPSTAVGSYFLTRSLTADTALPKDGVVGFKLTAGEAYVVEGADRAVSALIQNPVLTINFGTRQFDTSLTVVGGGRSIDVKAQGDLTSQGELLSDIVRSNATVRGYTAGPGAQEVAYIFNRLVDGQVRAIGATSWSK